MPFPEDNKDQKSKSEESQVIISDGTLRPSGDVKISPESKEDANLLSKVIKVLKEKFPHLSEILKDLLCGAVTEQIIEKVKDRPAGAIIKSSSKATPLVDKSKSKGKSGR